MTYISTSKYEDIQHILRFTLENVHMLNLRAVKLRQICIPRCQLVGFRSPMCTVTAHLGHQKMS